MSGFVIEAAKISDAIKAHARSVNGLSESIITAAKIKANSDAYLKGVALPYPRLEGWE